MRIVYYSYWPTYAAYLAAALHTGTYADHLPSQDRFSRQLELGKRYSGQFGNLLYIGLDENLREIYSLGCKGNYGMVYRAINGFNSIYGIDEPVHFIKTNHIEGVIPFYIEMMRPFVGNPLSTQYAFHHWIEKRYYKCKDFVNKVKLDLEGQ
ncbi:MAG TPA: DUF3189 family protein [Bacillota bacterium]|nr:DUF3189 family protein [Bacillota bacterium]